MKYLKKYNESKDISKEIEKYCKDHLSYLLDENPNLKFYINYHNRLDKYLFVLDFPHDLLYRKNIYFNWNDIKNEFIPFLKIFNNKYSIGKNNNNVSCITFLTINDNGIVLPISYTIEDILDNIMDYETNIYNGVEEQLRLKSIKFYFKLK